jgi:hypothetical protein
MVKTPDQVSIDRSLANLEAAAREARLCLIILYQAINTLRDLKTYEQNKGGDHGTDKTMGSGTATLP